MDPALYEIFSKEVADHLANVKQFVDIARVEQNKNYVTPDLLRALHTLAGSARMAGADAIASISGLLEHYAQGHMSRQVGLETIDFDRICQGVAYIEEDLAAHADPELSPPEITEYLEELTQRVKEFDTTAISQSLQDELVSEDKDFDLIELFIDEAADILDFLETTIQRIENDPEDKASITELHRSLHTLKGGARLAGFTGIGTLSHSLESVVTEIGESNLKADETFMEVLHLTFDRLSDMVDQARQGKSLLPPDEILARIAQLQGDKAASSLSEEVAEEQDMELVEVFLEEADEILTGSNLVLQRWIDEPDNTDLIVEMQRALHTFKGGARMAGFWPMGNLGHVLETLLVDVQEGRVPASDAFFDLLEAIQIRLEEMLESAKVGAEIRDPADLLVAIEKLRKGQEIELDEPVAQKTPEPAEPKEALSKAPSAKTPVAEKAKAQKPATDTSEESASAPGSHEMVRVRADLLDNLVNYAGEVSLYRARTEQQVTTLSTNLVEMEQTVLRLREQLRKLEIETEAQILFRYEREGEQKEISDFDPLEMDRFSTLQQLSRALAESVGDLFNIGGALDHITRDAETLLLQQSRVNTELQEGLMRCRMVPFANAVPRLRRILRQTCQELRKKAQLKVVGAQGEMDRTVMERITAPLEHLLRNSIAHGIESPEARVKQNKNETGNVTISVSREGPEVVIRVADDGGGINHDAIRAKAKALGWMREDQVLSDTEVAQFILETGFSTADSISQIAGRGVGMEVVHNEIKQLGGTLHILSERGVGTEFTIRLPFTLAINQVLMVQVLEEVYAIPLSSIDGVVRMTHEQLTRCFAKPDESWYDYAGQRYQVVSMTHLLGSGAPVLPGEGKRSPVVLVQAGENRLALHVDGLMGNREIVVKAVGPQVSSIPGIMGATILGNGRVVLILDMGALVRINVSGLIEPLALAGEFSAEKVRKYSVMVVDDSITVRKVTARLLERHGFEAITAKDGVDAVTQLQEIVPDLMLLDVEMPRMDGFELATHMRNDERLIKVPIIMITSRTGEKHRERARKIGVNDYMGKPYQESELLQKVRQFLGISDAG
jgi:chemosensory pili system protein ChpA (sensor histidine kinase/response regulator)